MTETQASKILLDISFGNVWFYRDYHGEAADTLVNAYRKLRSKLTVTENTNDEHVQTITKLQSQLAKENTRNQELEEIIQKQKKVTADAVNNETRVRELEVAYDNLEDEKDKLLGENDTLEHDLYLITQAKKELEADLNKYELKFDDLEKELAEKTAQVEELQSIRDDLNWFKAEIRKFYDEVMKDGDA